VKILVVGSGGREHALCWSLRRSPFVEELFCAPGNPGIAEVADCVPVAAGDIVEIADLAEKLKMDLTVVGPELPLSLGIVDEFMKRGLPIFGPTRLAAQIESSKVFAKEFFKRHDIPTADSAICSSAEQARKAIKGYGFPVVLKADGLAGGKGVLIVESDEDAERALRLFFQERVFGAAGDRIVVEEFLRGQESSFLALFDGADTNVSVAHRDSTTVPTQALFLMNDPFLHTVTVSVTGPGVAEDRVKTYFGLRTISAVDLPGTTHRYVAINGTPVYLQLALDQAYHPDGYYTFPSDSVLRDEILRARRIGLNGLGEHIKIETPRKLYWADKLGVLIMADVPNWWGPPTDTAFKEHDDAMRAMIDRDYNHPAIFAWISYNESWGLLSKVNDKDVYLPETQT